MMQREEKPKLSYRGAVLTGLVAAFVLVGGGLTWASVSQIAGAIIAPGTLIVKGKPKSIQHLDGGVVESIQVDTGDVVREGAVLIELDPTTIAANLSIYKGRLREAIIRRQRLLAELAAEDDIKADAERAELFTEQQLAANLDQQRRLMQARKATRGAQLAQFDEKIAQFENQTIGVSTLLEHKNNQILNFQEERQALQTLVDKGVSPRNSLLSLDRAISDTLGQLGEHGAEIARIKNSVAETRLSKFQFESEYQETLVAELEDAQTKIEELTLQADATAKQLARTTIRSPVDGIVHELSVFTIGGVVQPGQTVMQIVPGFQPVDIELSIEPRSIDQVYQGQDVILRFSAFNQRVTPQIQGSVAGISPTSVVDQRTDREFFRVYVAVSEEELTKLEGQKLVPGMPVEGFIQTGERAVLTYLVKPITDNFQHVFREE